MKPSKLFILVCLGVFIAFSSCKKNGPTTFTLQLQAKFGNQNVVLDSTISDGAGHYIQTQHLAFYLSHINLVKSNGTLVPVSQVALFNFAWAPPMLTVTANNIEGDFTGINFSCGLDSLTNTAANADNLTTIVPPNPLSNAYGMTWSMLIYQFEVFDGLWDTQDTIFLHQGFAYHIGTNPAYRPNVQMNKTFTVSGNPYTLVMYLDLAQIFNNAATHNTINLVTENECMSEPTDNQAILPAFATNFANAFTFEGP